MDRRGFLCLVLAACGGSEATTSSTVPRGERELGEEIAAPARYRAVLSGAALYMTHWLAPSSEPTHADLPREPGRSARRENVSELECDGVPVELGTDGWILPSGCSALHYQVAFDTVPETGARAVDRRSLRSASRNLWLLSGASVFVVPDSLSERPTIDLDLPESVHGYHRLAASTGLGHVLPARSALGRVFIGAGGFRVVDSSDGGTRFRHLFDGDSEVDRTGMALGVQYLLRVTGAAAPSALDVFWLGLAHGSAPRLTGAAGLDALLVNYWTGLPENAALSTRRAALAVFFEQYFVAIVGRDLPPWLTRSLGQYYALKAWSEAGAVSREELATIVRASAGRADRPASVPAAHDRWVDSGSDDDYREFYRGGLGFWSALDAHLASRTAGDKGLDDVLQGLLELIYAGDGTPPMRFLQLVEDAGGTGAATVTTRWLGWPEE
jgi:hypothetical protein